MCLPIPAVFYWFSSPSVTTRCFSAHPPIPACKCLLLEMKGLPLGLFWDFLLLLPGSAVLQVSVQKGWAAGKAIFTTPQHNCIHLLWDNHELWTHLQPWTLSRPLLDELPPLWCWMVPSGVRVPTPPQLLHFCAVTGCSCTQTALLWLSTVCAATQRDLGAQEICFSFPSPFEVFLPFWEDEDPFLIFFNQEKFPTGRCTVVHWWLSTG